ncbi:MAG: sigma-70 family RNA polymerase sigma factor [Thermoanaerobaculia bacterium]
MSTDTQKLSFPAVPLQGADAVLGGPVLARTRGRRAPAADVVDYEGLLLEHLDFIERTVGSLARRNALKPWDADDFEGLVKLRLVTDDYAILRKFQGRSRLTTFLTSVIQNLYRDYRIHRWGKWRPSAAAKRMGDLGVQLEALLYRDGFKTSEAFEILRERLGVTASDSELETLVGELKPRTTRRFESDGALAWLAAPDRCDEAALDRERAEAMKRAEDGLCRALKSLETEERLILKMRFGDSLTIRAIAEALDLPQRQMYTRVQSLLGKVRRRVEEQGVSCEDVLDLLDWPACDLDAGLSEPSSEH